jgi:hypothetical protein
MRYHKAVEITEEEAFSITNQRTTAVSDVVVVSRGDRYYDVRTMNDAEIKAFIDDLAREEHAALKATALRPS